jgi:hypothetical protein
MDAIVGYVCVAWMPLSKLTSFLSTRSHAGFVKVPFLDLSFCVFLLCEGLPLFSFLLFLTIFVLLLSCWELKEGQTRNHDRKAGNSLTPIIIFPFPQLTYFFRREYGPPNPHDHLLGLPRTGSVYCPLSTSPREYSPWARSIKKSILRYALHARCGA